jgi:hypothetical protein
MTPGVSNFCVKPFDRLACINFDARIGKFTLIANDFDRFTLSAARATCCIPSIARRHDRNRLAAPLAREEFFNGIGRVGVWRGWL